MPNYIQDKAFVLTVKPLGEADTLITIIAEHNGKIRLVAKGANKTTSKMRARLLPFQKIDIAWSKSLGLPKVIRSQVLNSYLDCLKSEILLKAYFPAAEFILKLTVENHDSKELFELFHRFISNLAKYQSNDASVLLAWFMVNTFRALGFLAHDRMPSVLIDFGSNIVNLLNADSENLDLSKFPEIDKLLLKLALYTEEIAERKFHSINFEL